MCFWRYTLPLPAWHLVRANESVSPALGGEWDRARFDVRPRHWKPQVGYFTRVRPMPFQDTLATGLRGRQ